MLLVTASGPLLRPKIVSTLFYKRLKISMTGVLPTLSSLLHSQPLYMLQAALRWRHVANLNETALGFFAAQARSPKKRLTWQ